MADFSTNMDPTSPYFGDWLVINGDVVLTTDVDPRGTDPVLQNIVQRLRTYEGEWFLDLTDGTPWYQEIMLKGAKQSDRDNAIQAVILNTPGVAVLTRYASTYDHAKRRASITFQALKAAGGVVDYTVNLGVGEI